MRNLRSEARYGAIFSVLSGEGFTWDEGPACTIYNNEYVKQLFADGVDGEYEECAPGSLIIIRINGRPPQPIPYLYQIPEPLRTQCLKSFMEARLGNLLLLRLMENGWTRHLASFC